MALRNTPLPRFFQDAGQDVVFFLNTLLGRRAQKIDALGLTVSDPPTQAEVQAISDKVDALTAAMKAAGLMEP